MIGISGDEIVIGHGISVGFVDDAWASSQHKWGCIELFMGITHNEQISFIIDPD